MKRGRFGNDEIDYIRDTIARDGLKATANALNRSEESVKDFALKLGITFDTVTEREALQSKASEELENSPEWQSLADEFSLKELEYFKYRFGKLLAQFKNDVFASEETQIHQLIKFEILMNRNLRSTKKCVAEMRKLEARLVDLHTANPTPDTTTMQLMNTLENQLLSLRNSQGSKSVEFVRLQEKHSAIMKDLKATRDQRMTRVESSKSSIVTLLKEFREREFQEHMGKQMHIMELALNKEKQRLGGQHKYDDGNIDRPVLSVDTLDIENEESEDE